MFYLEPILPSATIVLSNFKKGNLKDQRAKEDTYITKGFSSWKKTPKCSQAHHDSCHKAASSYQLIIPRCHDVGELMDS